MANKKLFDNENLLSLAKALFNASGKKTQDKFLNASPLVETGKLADGSPMLGAPTSFADATSNGISLGNLGTLGVGAAAQHPFKTAGLLGLGAGNIGGLTDNDKFGGQIAGLGLGGLGAATLASGNPYMQAMLTMGGGALGSLFDKLRARREQEQAQPYYGGR